MSANFTPEKEDYKILTPFKMQVLTNFPYIEADFDALTNYQLLCKVVEYLNGVIHNENEVTEQVNSLYNAFISLQNYVNTYFDNLDLQEEVDNKLDEMAESGQLTDIIAQYLGLAGMITYNNVAEMKSAENLVNGSKCQTLGYYNVNDGGNAIYKIRTITNDDVIDEKFIIELNDNTLIAELIYNDELIINKIGGKANDNTFDNYDYFESAKSHNVSTIKFLKGTYYFSRIVLNNGINIKGSGILNTTIKALVSAYTNFISLNYGPIAYLKFEDLKIEGNSSNSGQTGLYIYGLPAQSGLAHGGMWYTIFENIYVSHFTKNQIYFEGHDPQDESLVVSQFITFNNVYAYGNANSEDVIKIIHQQGQFVFNNCEFDKAPSTYYNIYINKGDCLFNQLTCQSSDNGIYTEGSNITINKVWFEGIVNNLINQQDNNTTFGGITLINGGTIRNCCKTADTKGFITSRRSIVTLNDLSFRESCLYMLFDNENGNNDSLTYTNCYFSQTPQTIFNKGFYLLNDTNGVINVNTHRTLRIDPLNNITNFTFGDKVKELTEINIYAHNAITFEGSKFINPTTIAKNGSCKIIRINSSMGTDVEKFYIIG